MSTTLFGSGMPATALTRELQAATFAAAWKARHKGKVARKRVFEHFARLVVATSERRPSWKWAKWIGGEPERVRPTLTVALDLSVPNSPDEVTKLCWDCETHISGPPYREGVAVTTGICPNCKGAALRDLNLA